jgi:hypothetical protein
VVDLTRTARGILGFGGHVAPCRVHEAAVVVFVVVPHPIGQVVTGASLIASLRREVENVVCSAMASPLLAAGGGCGGAGGDGGFFTDNKSMPLPGQQLPLLDSFNLVTRNYPRLDWLTNLHGFDEAVFEPIDMWDDAVAEKIAGEIAYALAN